MNSANRIRLTLSLSVVLLASLSSQARAGFSLGAAAGYGVVTGPNDSTVSISGSTVYGNFGIDQYINSGNLKSNDNANRINGDFNIANGTPYTANAVRGIVGTITGNVNGASGGSDSGVQSAALALSGLSGTFQGLSGNSLGSGTIEATTGKYNTLNDSYIFTTTAVNFLNNPLTIDGAGLGSSTVVINVTGSGNVNLYNNLLLTGGLTADHVFINIVGSGGTVQNTSGSSIEISAIVYVANDVVNLSKTDIDGGLGGGNGGTFTLSNDVIGVPEPSSLVMVLIGGGLAAGVTAYRKRVSKQAAV